MNDNRSTAVAVERARTLPAVSFCEASRKTEVRPVWRSQSVLGFVGLCFY